MRDSQVSSWNRPAKKRVRCVLSERAMYARAVCRWVDVGLGARGLGEGDNCTIKTAQTLLANLDECFDASIHQPRGTQYWSLHIDNCEVHSEFFSLTPEVHGPGLLQRNVCEILTQTCSVAPVSTRSSIVSFSRSLESSTHVSSSHSHPDCG